MPCHGHVLSELPERRANSDPAADVYLESPGIRSFHCAIGMRGKEIPAVWGLSVESRTQINGQRHMGATVAQGDLLTIGGMSFRIHLQVVTAMRSSLAG